MQDLEGILGPERFLQIRIKATTGDYYGITYTALLEMKT